MAVRSEMLRSRLSKSDALRLGDLLGEVSAQEDSLRAVVKEVLELCGVGSRHGSAVTTVDEQPAVLRTETASEPGPITDREIWVILLSFRDGALPLDLEVMVTVVENLLTTLIETRSPRSIARHFLE